MIYGDGRTSDKNVSYPIFRDGDIITMQLDCRKGIFCVGINEYWFGNVYNNLPINDDDRYQLFISVKQ